jgi:hypothetical protein
VVAAILRLFDRVARVTSAACEDSIALWVAIPADATPVALARLSGVNVFGERLRIDVVATPHDDATLAKMQCTMDRDVVSPTWLLSALPARYVAVFNAPTLFIHGVVLRFNGAERIVPTAHVFCMVIEFSNADSAADSIRRLHSVTTTCGTVICVLCAPT